MAAYYQKWGFPGGPVVKNPPASAGDVSLIPGSDRSPGTEMAAHSRTLAQDIPWTEEPGRLRSTGGQRAGHDLVTKHNSIARAEAQTHLESELPNNTTSI